MEKLDNQNSNSFCILLKPLFNLLDSKIFLGEVYFFYQKPVSKGFSSDLSCHVNFISSPEK